MNAVAVRGGGGAAAAAPAPAAAARRARLADPLVLRLATFAALAGFGAGHWAALVGDPPLARMAAGVAIATAGAAGLGLLGRARLGRRARGAAAAAVAAAGLVLGLLAAGLPARLLLPGGFEELADGLDRGLSGVQGADWPYNGGDDWVRLTVLLGAPLLLSLAAGLAFWPARRGAPALRAAALVLLLVLYGTAVTEHDPGAPLARGVALLALVAAWLWLPRLRAPEAPLAAAVVACAGLLALPLAAQLDADRPLWDYRAWSLFGAGKSVSFEWDHSYGPLDWPREGTTLLNVRSDRRHYWRVETLDDFDGFRWLRSGTSGAGRADAELPARLTPEGPTWEPYEFNPRWRQRLRFTVRSLSTSMIVGAGTTYAVRGAGSTIPLEDGTTLLLGEPLEKGDQYWVTAYAPNPTAAQMRAAPAGYAGNMVKHTSLYLPLPGETARNRVAPGAYGRAARERRVFVPLRGKPLSGSDGASRRLLASPYADVFRLARRLTDGRPTVYDAVKAVQDHLQRELAYSERPPSRDFPLAAFLFEDEIGYCQQFSGAMALMLRMAGIPARVASGFSPGSYNRDTGEYRVRDLDAHSWVEVNFAGIGWVPFDPTPTAAPAQSQSAGLGATSALRGESGEVSSERAGSGGSEHAGDGAGGGARDSGRPWWAAALLAALVAAASGALLLRRRAGSRRSASPRAAAEAQVRELESALRRLGWRLEPGTTLLALERRLARAAGPASARYAGRLRSHRYDRRSPAAPGLDERRAARRELTARGGLRGRLRGLLAMPPGGPRVRP